jgi:hypothetical protein
MLLVIIFLDQQAVLTEGLVSALIYFTMSLYLPVQGIFNHILFPLPTQVCASERVNLKEN